MTALHPRPHPSRRLPRVLPTPPRKPYMSERRRGLHRIVYDEAFHALTTSGTRPMDAMSATAVALALAGKVVARYTDERR